MYEKQYFAIRDGFIRHSDLVAALQVTSQNQPTVEMRANELMTRLRLYYRREHGELTFRCISCHTVIEESLSRCLTRGHAPHRWSNFTARFEMDAAHIAAIDLDTFPATPTIKKYLIVVQNTIKNKRPGRKK